MSTQKSTAEALLLKFFKVTLLVILSLTLVVAAGALAFAAYQYAQSPKAPAPAQKPPAKAVTMDEFLNKLKEQELLKDVPKTEAPPPGHNAQPEPVKYKEEASKLLECLKESNKLAGIAQEEPATSASEDFRKQLQEVTDSPAKDRGQPFVTDSEKLTCEILQHAQVLEYRTAHPAADLFTAALNFHMNTWDDLKEAAKAFKENEQTRISQEVQSEQTRIAQAKSTATLALLVAAGAVALLVTLGFALMVTTMASNLRRISASLDAMNEAKAKEALAKDLHLPTSDEGIQGANWPDLNVTFQPDTATPPLDIVEPGPLDKPT